MANQLTEDLLIDIEQAVADGATTDKEISDAIGWNYETFKSWKLGKRKNGESESTQIYTAIKKGQSRQRKHFLQVAEYSLMKRIKGYNYKETTIEQGSTDKGDFEKTKVVEKQVEPNITAIIFALVNSGKWQSVNREQMLNVQDGKITIKYERELPKDR
jgi:hypothetical protein